MVSKKKLVKWEEHIDHDWIEKKINGHAACYGFDTTHGIVTIDFIYGKSHFKIFWYNLILLIKFLVRHRRRCD